MDLLWVNPNLKLEEVDLVPLKNVIEYCDANISTQPLIRGGKTNMSQIYSI